VLCFRLSILCVETFVFCVVAEGGRALD
jgi:hypothetical protein